MTRQQRNGADLRVIACTTEPVPLTSAWLETFRESLRDVVPSDMKELNDWIRDCCQTTSDVTTGIPHPVPHFKKVIDDHMEMIMDLAQEAFRDNRARGSIENLMIRCEDEIFHDLPWGDVLVSMHGFQRRLQEVFLLSAAMANKESKSADDVEFTPLHELPTKDQHEIVLELFSDGLEVVKGLRDHGFDGDARALAAANPVIVYDAKKVCLYIAAVASEVDSSKGTFKKRGRDETRASLAIVTKALERIPRPRTSNLPLAYETARNADHPLARGAKEKPDQEDDHRRPELTVVNNTPRRGLLARRRGTPERLPHPGHNGEPKTRHLIGLPSLKV